MSLNIKPLADRVLVKVSEAETTTASGIIILGPIYGILGISFSFVLASLGNFTYLFFANRAFQVTQKWPRL